MSSTTRPTPPDRRAGHPRPHDGAMAPTHPLSSGPAPARSVTAEGDGMTAGRRPDRSEMATADELSSFAARVVAVLPHDQAEVVLLRVLGGLDVEDVARVLHKQPGTVRSLQQRALRRLAHQVDPEPLSA